MLGINPFYDFYLAGLSTVELFLIIFGLSNLLTLAGLLMVHRYFHARSERLEGIRLSPLFYHYWSSIGCSIGDGFGYHMAELSKRKGERYCRGIYLVNIYRDAGAIEKAQGDAIRVKVKQMVTYIIIDSWPRMEKGQEGQMAMIPFNELFSYVREITPKNFEEELVKETWLKASRRLQSLVRIEF